MKSTLPSPHRTGENDYCVVIASEAKQSLSFDPADMGNQYYIYIMTNKLNRVLYTGVTNDLKRRCFEHREKFVKGFTSRYNVNKLVYYEIFEDPENAITREKQIKGGSRAKKIELVKKLNPDWKDLYDEI